MQIEQTKTLGDLVNHVQAMPDSLQQEIFDFVDFLRMRSHGDISSSEIKPKKKRHAGTLKGEVVFADDFDEPL